MCEQLRASLNRRSLVSLSFSLALTFDLFLLVMRFIFEFLSISPVSVYSGGSPCKQACNIDSRFFCICSATGTRIVQSVAKAFLAD